MNRPQHTPPDADRLQNEDHLQNADHLQDAEIARLLRTHLGPPADQLTPSSGFAASVMDALHQHTPMPATIPPPIPFPWKQALPVAAGLLLVLAAFLLYVSSHPAFLASSQGTRLLSTLAVEAITLSAGATTTLLSTTLLSTVAAIALSLAAAAVSFQLATRRH